jgi:hypothetical protein
VLTGCNWLKVGFNGNSCEHGNEPLVSVMSWEFVDLLMQWFSIFVRSWPSEFFFL